MFESMKCAVSRVTFAALVGVSFTWQAGAGDPSTCHAPETWEWMMEYALDTGGSNQIADMARDDQGNFYIGGRTLGTFPGQQSAGGWDGFLLKLDSQGDYVWVKQFGTNTHDYVTGVAVDLTGHIYVFGRDEGDFPGPQDAWLRKYTASGNLLWVVPVATNSWEYSGGVAVAADGSVYVTGETFGTFPGQQKHGEASDAFLAKYTTNGSLVWVRQFGSATAWNNMGLRVRVDSTGRAIVMGTMDAPFLAAYSAGGTQLWLSQFSASGFTVPSDVALDASDAIYVSGRNFGFWPGQGSAGEYDAFLVKYGSDGTQMWAQQFGSPFDEFGNRVTVDIAGDVYMSGSTWGTLPCQQKFSGVDSFVLKFNASGALIWARQYAGGHGPMAPDDESGVYIVALGAVSKWADCGEAPAAFCPSPCWQPAIGQPGMNGSVEAMAPTPVGLIVGGTFTTAGSASVDRIARWDGSNWHPLGSGMDASVLALAAHDGNVVAGGGFTVAGGVDADRIARWDGSNWHPIGSGMSGGVAAITSWNGDLIAGGNFTFAGDTEVNYIARWDGLSWQPLGEGMNARVEALIEYDGDLIAGGEFTTAGGVSANRIARWDGSSWHPLGEGMSAKVWRALAVYDGDLIVGGNFITAGGTTVNRIARWNGSTWQAMGDGMNAAVFAVHVHDRALFEAGAFTSAGGQPAAHIAKWNGEVWEPLDSGMANSVFALARYGDDLIAGGSFVTLGIHPARRIAAWRDCSEPKCAPADLNCDGVVGVADLLLLLSQWGTCANCAPGACPADLDGNCTVGVADLLILLANWG